MYFQSTIYVTQNEPHQKQYNEVINNPKKKINQWLKNKKK